MKDVMQLLIGDDGKATLYDDTYDITIHCESEGEQAAVIAKLKSMEWIPVSERLPELGARVLVSDGEDVEMSQLGKRYRDGYVWEFATCWNDLEDWPYWMPLPEPWRGNAE